MGVSIAALPGHERPRERLASCGVEALTERELLALVLRTGRLGESALDLATALLLDFGSIERLASARPEELAARAGVGPAKAAALVAALRLGRLASLASIPRRLGSAGDVAVAARELLDGQRRERVVVLICDAVNQLRRCVLVSEGAADRSPLPVREILNAVLRHDGRAFAVAHNHPSGDPEPSDADRTATAALTRAAATVGLRFLDHVIVAGDQWCRVPATASRRTPG
ncbi:MAG: DNA repair protein RadC [Acidimicrobiia bacterium]